MRDANFHVPNARMMHRSNGSRHDEKNLRRAALAASRSLPSLRFAQQRAPTSSDRSRLHAAAATSICTARLIAD